MADFELQAQLRETHGKAHCRRMRRKSSNIPAVIYGAGKDSVSITLCHNKVIKALESEAFYSPILTVTVDKTEEKVVLKDVQRHPAKEACVLHMDFLRINANEKLKMNVPLHFINEATSIGVKEEGGVITHNMTDVEVICLPKNLPEFIDVDMAALKTGDNIHLTDLKLPKGVEITALLQGEEHNSVVANIHAPHIAAEPEPEAETTEESSEAAADTKDEKKSEG